MAEEVTNDRNSRVENDDSYRRDLTALFKNLRSQAISNAEYFQEGRSQNSERFHASFRRLYEHLDRGIEPGVECLLGIAHQYDFDAHTPANGYRSMVKTIHKCCIKIHQLTRYISVTRESFLFRSGHYSRELEAYVTTLGQLRACLYYMERLLSYSGGHELFPDEQSLSAAEYATAERLMMEVETLCQETFYGRCLAFQYCESMARPLTTIIVAMAAFADTHLTNSSMLKMASTLLGSGKYIMDPELRAQQIVNVTRNGDIQFLKDFWNVAESDFLHQIPLYVCPPVAVDKVITLQPETFELPRTDGTGFIKITPPCAHSGPFPVQTRLISYKLRQGQEHWFTKPLVEPVLPLSPCLVFHCHGGGFVAQSSASHQLYLRHWAKDLNVPIFSVDYSLAPEFPFPRQLEEIFFAYCWALRNHSKLGWTGERVCFAGDSAGGNMIVATTMRALTLKVRAPDGLMSIYGVMLVRYCPSPSRIMALLDPLLSVGVMANCLAAYSGVGQSTLVSTPYYHGPNHRASKTPTPMTPHAEASSPVTQEDDVSPLINPSPPLQINKAITRHKSTASGDSGFHDLIKSPSTSVKSRESEMESSTTSDASLMKRVETVDALSILSGSSRMTLEGDKEMDRTTVNIDETVAELVVASSETSTTGSPRHTITIHQEDKKAPTQDQPASSTTKSNSEEPTTEPAIKPMSMPTSPTGEISPPEGKPKRSGMWLDFGGFFGRNIKHTRSPSSPATLASLTDETRKTQPDHRSARDGTNLKKGKEQEDIMMHGNFKIDYFEKARQETLDTLLAALSARLSDLNDPVIKSSGLADLSRWPDDYTQALNDDFGDSDIDTIMTHYTDVLENTPNVDVSMIATEWNLLKLQLYKRLTSPFANVRSSLSSDAEAHSLLTYAQIRHFAQSPVVQFRHMPIARNPYMSPYLAPDNLLANMPPCYFQACHLDPMLDDSIAMAQRLRSLGREVHVTVHDDLPHGFLNFVLLSPEAKRGSDSIVQQIREILKLDDVDWNQFDVISAEDVEAANIAMEDDTDGGDAMRTSHSASDVSQVAKEMVAVQREASMPSGFRVSPCTPCL